MNNQLPRSQTFTIPSQSIPIHILITSFLKTYFNKSLPLVLRLWNNFPRDFPPKCRIHFLFYRPNYTSSPLQSRLPTQQDLITCSVCCNQQELYRARTRDITQVRVTCSCFTWLQITAQVGKGGHQERCTVKITGRFISHTELLTFLYADTSEYMENKNLSSGRKQRTTFWSY